MDRKEHWETIYATKPVSDVSWFEADPRVSLELIELASPSHGRVIDVGGGASLLVDRLLDRGFKKVAVLDISAGALQCAQSRLAERASQVEWIVADVTKTGFETAGTVPILRSPRSKMGLSPSPSSFEAGSTVQDLGQFDVWHDRAVFHFLTEPQDRRNYVELATRTVPVGGHLVIGTFAIDGPSKCSGLDVCQYDAQRMTGALGPAFKLIQTTTHTHTTPAGKPQKFFFGVFQRV
jgi:SAM-dependent methyltransferase